MKVCSNCGAEHEAQFEYCPYCGAQNIQIVQKQHQGKVKQLKKQREYIKKLPQIIPKKANKYVLFGGVTLLVLFLIVILVVFVGGTFSEYSKEKKEQKNIEIMEAYLAEEDYAGLSEFYQEVEHSYAVYDKYDEVCEFYSHYDRMLEYLNMIQEYGDAVNKSNIVFDIVDVMDRLQRLIITAEESMNDTRRLSNEYHIEQIKNKGIESFMKILQVDDRIVEQILSFPDYDEAPVVFEELAEEIYDNLF